MSAGIAKTSFKLSFYAFLYKKIVTPVKTGVQNNSNRIMKLDAESSPA
ncbi:MAG: hypothetical protein J7K30_11010 [Deltaproteobacteria bacterium]|nr:hypothetical protein [Deltaproteobacteria bacterium]